MNVKINFINSKNLYHVVKKRSLNQNELSAYLITHPEFNRLMGALPYDWLKAVQNNDIKSLSENVAAAFSKFAQNISDIHTKIGFEVIRGAKLRFKKFQNVLEQELKNLLQRQDISVGYTESGAYKHCHKITVGDYDYALSTFIENENYFNNLVQGKGYEPQNIFTLYRNGEHGRWVKPFFSKVAGKSDTDGFILSKFIDNSRPKKSAQGTFERKHLKVKNNDYASRNTINGVYIDTGGSVLNENYIENKELRILWLELARVFDRLNGIFENYKYRRFDRLLVKDMNNGIDIFDKYYLERYILSPSQKRLISAILKNLKSAMKLKNKAKDKNLLASVRDIFDRDLQGEFPYLEEIWGTQDGRYYSKSFTKLLGISNKLPSEQIAIRYDYLPIWEIRKDYTQSEIIEGMIKSWQYISKKRNILKKICEDFSISSEQYDYIKKEGRAAAKRI